MTIGIDALKDDLKALAADFGRLFLSDVECVAHTYRRYYPSRNPNHESAREYLANREPRFLSPKGDWPKWDCGPGLKIHPREVQQSEGVEAAGVFYDELGMPVLNVADQGWADTCGVYLAGPGMTRAQETFRRANRVVKAHLHDVARLLKPGRTVTFGSNSWPSVVNRVAELSERASLPEPVWKVTNGEGRWSVEAWRRRAEISPGHRWYTAEDEAAIGDEPERMFAVRETFLRDSESAVAWLLEQLKTADSPPPRSSATKASELPDPSTVRLDGSSPLTRYVGLLHDAAFWIPRFVSRDAEAVAILTAEPALPLAIDRAEGRYWDAYRSKQTGKMVATPRVWTRRDERFVRVHRGHESGFYPPRRTSLLVDRLLHIHCVRFREAVNEARSDQTLGLLGPKLEAAKVSFEALLGIANELSVDDGSQTNFDSLVHAVESSMADLFDWTKPAKEQLSEASTEKVLSTVEGSTGWRLLRLAERLHEFDGSPQDCKAFIRNEQLIGGEGVLIRAFNDASLDAKTHHTLGRLAAVLGCVYRNRMTGGVAARKIKALLGVTVEPEQSAEANRQSRSDSPVVPESLADGLDPKTKTMIWGGKRYERLTPRIMDILAVLLEAHRKGRKGVGFEEISTRVEGNYDGGFYKAFKVKRGGKRQTHPVRDIVSGDGFYHLVDPKKVSE